MRLLAGWASACLLTFAPPRWPGGATTLGPRLLRLFQNFSRLSCPASPALPQRAGGLPAGPARAVQQHGLHCSDFNCHHRVRSVLSLFLFPDFLQRLVGAGGANRRRRRRRCGPHGA